MILLNVIIELIYILQNFYVKSENLSNEVKKELCDLVVKNNRCNVTILKKFVCENCQDECKNNIIPDCNSLISGECNDYYDYCPDVKSLCDLDYMKNFLYQFCPATCGRCIPIVVNITTTPESLPTKSIYETKPTKDISRTTKIISV
uniref:ShKT domain-containing protein n=1 Tax=Strongyloides stercoralis TaxID=6248 RepID=A0A0K0DWP9_STRER